MLLVPVRLRPKDNRLTKPDRNQVTIALTLTSMEQIEASAANAIATETVTGGPNLKPVIVQETKRAVVISVIVRVAGLVSIKDLASTTAVNPKSLPPRRQSARASIRIVRLLSWQPLKRL